ncbi:hypothetical protein D4S03_10645 [bacterium]|nr:MAG: hypothetical protein D4S03_10645 [bacterium]
MEVRFRLHWGLGRYLPDSPAKGIILNLPGNSSIEDLLERHGIPASEVGVVVVNGSLVERDRILNNHDEVQLYPPMEGG